MTDQRFECPGASAAHHVDPWREREQRQRLENPNKKVAVFAVAAAIGAL